MTDPVEASIAAHEAGRLLEAYDLARDHARAHPADPRAWHQLGLVLQDMGDLPKAAAMLDRALTLAPAHATILHLRGRIELARGRPAQDWLDRAQEARPQDPAIALSRGMAALAEGDAAAALNRFAEVTMLYPSLAQGHASLAALRYQLGDRDTFADSFEATLAQAPRDIALWRAWAVALISASQPARALEAVVRARAAAGRDPAFDMLELCALTDLGDTAAAATRFAALPVGADDAVLRHTRIRHLIASGDPHAAATLAEATVARPGGEGAWPWLATAWALTGNPRLDWLFGDPRLIGVYDLGDPPAGLADTLRTLHRTRIEPPEQSLRGGTQTDGDVLLREEPPIVALRAQLEAAIAKHIAQLPPPDPAHPVLSRPRARTRFAGSWSVRLEGAGFHVAHTHPRGWLSSAYYVAVPDAPAPQGWLKLGEPPANSGAAIAPFRRIEPKPGRLVLFPSILWHGTEPFPAGERLSVAFDVVPLI